ncbi:DNA methyltransferase [Aliarcobacter skirrowii]|uniref:DNA methyltransferase n=1 Tax=Aliarcobacter skirrowii TaxID=28200 RepID=UPI0029A27FFE|nr:DNA methyltransferase [Aliarcobacter skirrowii]MDX4028687.1 DNA methyltransferase [Aliarcobacter skirrowii]
MIDKENLIQFLKEKKLEDYSDEILKQLDETVKKALNDKLKEIKNKKRIISNDNNKEHFSANEIFTKEEIERFPTWVKNNIKDAKVVGSSKKVIQINNGKKYHIGNKLNDLSGAEWTFFLNSVVNTRYSTNGEDGYAHHIRKIHPSPKPPQLMKQIIEFFTKENEIVFDYFMGVGGSLLGSSLCNRRALGIDLNNKYINAYKEANEYLGLKEQTTIEADSISFLKHNCLKKYLKNEKISLILIDPPYGNMLSRPKTGEAVKKGKDTSATPFTDSELDLGNMNWDNFLEIFHNSIIDSMKYLKNKGHIVVFIKDLQPKDKELNLFHADIIKDLNRIDNLKYLGTKIWADQSVNLYPYGYPFNYVSNQVHQYIMIFQKV